MTPPSPISTDPLEVIEMALEPHAESDWGNRVVDAEARAALQQVRALVDAARTIVEAAYVEESRRSMNLEGIVRTLELPLTPFITQGSEERP